MESTVEIVADYHEVSPCAVLSCGGYGAAARRARKRIRDALWLSRDPLDPRQREHLYDLIVEHVLDASERGDETAAAIVYAVSDMIRRSRRTVNA